MASDAPLPPRAEDLEPWWLTAGTAAQENGALWSFERLLGLRHHPSSAVSRWAKRHLSLALAPIAVETLREVLEEPDEELAAWAALHLGVGGASGDPAAAGSGEAVYRRMLGSAGRLQGACAEALGWLGHQDAAEPLLRWAARGRDLGARPGVLAGLGRMPGCAEALAELVERAEEAPAFMGLAGALLEHRRPEDLERVDRRAQAVGIPALGANLSALLASACGGRTLGNELDIRLPQAWTLLDLDSVEKVAFFASAVGGPELPVFEVAADWHAGRAAAAFELLMEVAAAHAGTEEPADRCCLELVRRSFRAASVHAGATKKEMGQLLRANLMAVLGLLRRRPLRAAMLPGATAEQLAAAFVAASPTMPRELVLRAVGDPGVGARLGERLGHPLPFAAVRWIAVVAARQNMQAAPGALLNFLDGVGSGLSAHGTVLGALQLLGPATLAAARDGYTSGWIRTPVLPALAAVSSGQAEAGGLLAEMRRLHDLDAVLHAALSAQLGAADGLERIAADVQPENAAALLPAIETLTELHAAPPGHLERARRLASGRKPATTGHQGRRVGRNEPCPCGSDKKFKHCCLGSS